MDKKVIDLNEYKNNERLKIELKAVEKYGVVKISDDLYLVPECEFVSGAKEVNSLMNLKLKMKTNELLEVRVIDEINSLVTKRNEKIAIMILEEKDDNVIVFELFNASNDRKMLIETPMVNTEEHRLIFTGIITSAITYGDVEVTFYNRLTYDDLEETIY